MPLDIGGHVLYTTYNLNGDTTMQYITAAEQFADKAAVTFEQNHYKWVDIENGGPDKVPTRADIVDACLMLHAVATYATPKTAECGRILCTVRDGGYTTFYLSL